MLVILRPRQRELWSVWHASVRCQQSLLCMLRRCPDNPYSLNLFQNRWHKMPRRSDLNCGWYASFRRLRKAFLTLFRWGCGVLLLAVHGLGSQLRTWVLKPRHCLLLIWDVWFRKISLQHLQPRRLPKLQLHDLGWETSGLNLENAEVCWNLYSLWGWIKLSDDF